MNVIVCIKAVPDTAEVRIDPETKTLMRGEMELTINPFDLYAIEEGLRLASGTGGQVTVISMGPPKVEQQLREALAMGCDRAILLSSRAFAGADTWATAYTLARAIAKLGRFDLIICGKQALDGDTAQVGPGIANQLAIPQLTYVSQVRDVSTESGEITVERLLEEGREVVTSRLPALLTVLKDINQPRYPTPRNLRMARKQEIPIWGPDDLDNIDPSLLGLDGSPTKVVSISTPPARGGEVEMIAGDTVEAQASALADLMLQAI